MLKNDIGELIMDFISTTIHGFEDISAREISKIGGKIEKIISGKIIYSGEEDLIYRVNYSSKNVFRVVILLGMGEARSIEDIRNIVRNSKIDVRGNFEVKVEGEGNFKFRKDIEYVVREEILKNNTNARVSSSSEMRILCYLENNIFLFGMDTTGVGLNKRGYQIYKHPAPLNPIIASLLITWSNWKNEKLIDPFCGSGTIPIEAYHLGNRIPNKFRVFSFKNLPFYSEEEWMGIKRHYDRKIKHKSLDIGGIDKDINHVEGCKKNAQKAEAKISCIRGFAENLHLYLSNATFIITNPPFGLRIGSKKDIFSLYEKFAEELEEYFSGCSFVVITPYPKFEKYFRIIEKREFFYGNLDVFAYKIKI